jgi:hypothetical protein
LGNQAKVFTELGEDEQALARLKEQYSIWRTHQNWEGVANALVEQMKSLSRMGRTQERDQLAEEANRLASLPGCWMPKIEIIGDVITKATTAAKGEWWYVPKRTAAPNQFKGYLPSPHPSADPVRAARLNIEHQQELARWKALPWWKRLTAKKPEPPTGI